MGKIYQLIILDRDGVINKDSADYIRSPKEWHAITGSLEAITKLNKTGYKVVIISNQSGIARGYFTEKTLKLMHDKMIHKLTKLGGSIDHIYYCPHHPNENCECRKPKPKMLFEALHKFHVEPKNALMIGDSWTDAQLAKNAGCDFVLVKTGKGEKTYTEHQKDLIHTPVFDDLATLVDKMLS